MRDLSLLCVVAALAGTSARAAPASAADPFAYDHAAPLAVKELGIEQAGSIRIRHLAYSSPAMRREVDAYLVRPAGPGPFPAVLYLHMYPGSNRQFLEEAQELARSGVASLLVEGLVPWHQVPEGLEADRAALVQQVVELRRGLDLLAAEKDVDPARLAFVGMDYGAMHGAGLASVERRLRALVMIVPTATYEQWNSIVYHEPLGEEYQRGLQPLDPVERLPRVSAPVLLQFCTADFYVSRADAERLHAAAPEPKAIRWYEGKHGAAQEAGKRDRLEWLLAQLRAGPAR